MNGEYHSYYGNTTKQAKLGYKDQFKIRDTQKTRFKRKDSSQNSQQGHENRLQKQKKRSLKNLTVGGQSAELKSRSSQDSYLNTMTFKDLKDFEQQLITRPGIVFIFITLEQFKIKLPSHCKFPFSNKIFIMIWL